jgi:Tol biopolymer transport system component
VPDTVSGTPTSRPTASATVSGTPTSRPTASATVSGTPTSLPTATATPQGATPRPATATPQPPHDLQNKILFRSDRRVSPNPWGMNPDGTGAFMLADSSPYEAAKARESLSPDGSQRVYVGTVDGMPAILIAPTGGGQGQPLVVWEGVQLSSPVWSPVGNRVTFVSNASSGSQICLILTDGTGFRDVTNESWGVASHPTFSPDGLSLAYASSASPGRRQIWLIGIDGTGRINLSNNAHDDWDPVWVK